MSTLHDTTDAVATLLGTGTFSIAISPAVSYETDLELEDAGTVDVAVVAASLVQVPDSRISLRYDVGVDVAVRYRFGVDDQGADGRVTAAMAGAYLALLEELAEFLATPTNRALPAKPTATWTRNEIRYPWIPEHLRNQRQYTGIFRAMYVVAKDLA